MTASFRQGLLQIALTPSPCYLRDALGLCQQVQALIPHWLASRQNSASMPSRYSASCSLVRSAHSKPPNAGTSMLRVVCKSRLPLDSMPMLDLGALNGLGIVIARDGVTTPIGLSSAHSGALAQCDPWMVRGTPVESIQAGRAALGHPGAQKQNLRLPFGLVLRG